MFTSEMYVIDAIMIPKEGVIKNVYTTRNGADSTMITAKGVE
jgi:hypothetical protein